ncbi:MULTISPECIES: DUF3558 family protein [Pseudonocardia]|uniref:DUF3558 domain-containing protein n=2 Tax=Pseudonocardia TaxID=1847 RepID=A0A1Y2N7N3_PSEAH|nr:MULTISPECIES: DUF3558 family protein [Pseudonocardia]OSY43464.1 hypothetical protein BG845_00407 [Pseudonocardia autotrophica]TDN73542.1 uncharacterized protein DUF3558 [Pseudonocardia autotrophica]BBG04285.1 hypothetical protein Pdca_54940 [Pseudonocardia autotrophica]GEC25572.1 hypothetical protein PSA01_26010 [Pseudonocardia saturnea]
MARASRGRTTVLLVAIAALLTGCGADVPAGPFPPRPADIDTTSVDICAGLTPHQQAALGVEPGVPGTAELSEGPTRTCRWSSFDDGYNYSIQTLPVPAAVTVGSPDSTVQEISGYGVVQVPAHATSVPQCMTYVDTSDTVGIRTLTQATRPDKRDPTLIEEVCRRAEVFTSQVIENLRSAR